ncbi:alpha/beta fold hydrolase [Bacillus sp. M6-12]|uniref:alpha/beta fold hydrolase n=1 Tax=Bacillus sp. M6-12 TaxID=2054166 RepID=UPI0015E13124|nr:alpha/beta hydrolase [Bacillus sp. M6-12]
MSQKNRKSRGKITMLTMGIILILLSLFVLTLLGFRGYKQHKISAQAETFIKNGGISQIEKLSIGGVKHYLLIEGQDKNNPVCVFLHGGPGSPMPFGASSRSMFPEITKSCTAVYYDQRGAGKSYHKGIEKETMNIEQFISDANEIVDYIRHELHQDKVFIVGNSFGSIIGAELASRYPEKIHAYIGFAQVTDFMENQKLAAQWLNKEADKKHDTKMKSALQNLGEGPYSVKEADQLGDFLDKYSAHNYSDETVKKANIFHLSKGIFLSPDYSLADIYITLVPAANFSYFKSEALKEELNKTNLFKSVPKIEVPVYFIQGKHDKATNYLLAKQYYDKLIAPKGKEFIVLENSAHYSNKEDFRLFEKTLTRIVKTVSR